MLTSSNAPLQRWLFCQTQTSQADYFWSWVEPMRQKGQVLGLHPLAANGVPPWSMMKPQGQWNGIALWPDDPDSIHWERTAIQLGLSVKWFPEAVQEGSGDCPSVQSRM